MTETLTKVSSRYGVSDGMKVGVLGVWGPLSPLPSHPECIVENPGNW